jgi:hypothetical protein
MSGTRIRQKFAKKRSLHEVNEHFSQIFNAIIVPRSNRAKVSVYVVDGIPQYAAIVEERPGPSFVLARVSAAELEVYLRDNNLTPIRVRSFSEGDIRYFTVVAERIDVADWHWYDNLDSDTLAQKLDANDAYPFDLDSYRSEDDVHAVRFTVIMYPSPQP